MLNLRCPPKVQSALAYLWVPAASLIIDEAPQGAAALYHAVALRSCYGRVAAHEVEFSDYAEPSQTFGAMPIVVVKWKSMEGVCKNEVDLFDPPPTGLCALA